MVTGIFCIVVFISEQESDKNWLVEKVMVYTDSEEVFGRGGAPTYSDILCWYAKSPPAGLGLFPMRHPSHMGGVPSDGGGPGNILPIIRFPGIQRRSPNVRDHPPVSQSDGHGNF